jgi:hypothetical protein
MYRLSDRARLFESGCPGGIVPPLGSRAVRLRAGAVSRGVRIDPFAGFHSGRSGHEYFGDFHRRSDRFGGSAI